MAVRVILRAIVLVAGFLLSRKIKADREQLRAFECGFNTLVQGMLPFSLRFYLVANVFLIFDVELIILFPFFSKFSTISSWGRAWIFCVFLAILSLGLFHE